MQTSKNTKRFDELTTDELLLERDRMLGKVQTDSDFTVGSLMDHIYANPLGKLLQIISTLPEVRHEKVDYARSLIEQPEEELECRMDLALDKILEELVTEN